MNSESINKKNGSFSDRKMEVEAAMTSNELDELLKKYNIGKKPLADLLGWGKTTILAYSRGSMPSRGYSETLKKLGECPEEYLELLDKNKDRITPVAYEKSKKAAERCLYSDILSFARQVVDLDYQDVSQTELQMILFFYQFFSLGLYKRAGFNDGFTPNTKKVIPYPEVFAFYEKNGFKKSRLNDTSAGESLKLKEDVLRLKDSDLTIINNLISTFHGYSSNAIKSVYFEEISSLRKIYGIRNAKGIISSEKLMEFATMEMGSLQIPDVTGIREFFGAKTGAKTNTVVERRKKE